MILKVKHERFVKDNLIMFGFLFFLKPRKPAPGIEAMVIYVFLIIVNT